MARSFARDVVVVTGASAGLGRAIATMLGAYEGCRSELIVRRTGACTPPVSISHLHGSVTTNALERRYDAGRNGRGLAAGWSMNNARRLLAFALLVGIPMVSSTAVAESERVTHIVRTPFQDVVTTLQKAVENHKMVLVCEADAQKGAAARGVKIRGNRVLMVFRNDFAVRLLEADPSAGFEAPVRIYVYENVDGTTTISYCTPSAVFAPYRHPEVRSVAAALDPILKAIVEEALVVGAASPGSGRGTPR